jgi:DeoR/GlpR family transcriptional regulator of sugar metabolism
LYAPLLIRTLIKVDICARFAHQALTCADRACSVVDMSEHDQRSEGDRPGPHTIDESAAEFTQEKDAIGRRAAELVEDGAVVIVDAGTTTEFVARHLDAAGVTVFTNGIGAINVLLNKDDVSVVVLGGRLRPMNQTISGPEAEHMLHALVADYAFIGTDAVHPQYGIASRTIEQSRLKTLMMQRARQIVVVADRRKLSTDQFNYWSSLPAQWRLITDDDAEPAALDKLRSTGAQIDLTHPLRAPTDTANTKVNQP